MIWSYIYIFSCRKWLSLSTLLFSLPSQKKYTHVLLDCLELWLRHAFAMTSFWSLYARSQHLFPSRVAFIFCQYFVLIMGELGHCESLVQHIPMILNRVKVRTLWGLIHVWKRCLVLPEPLFHNLSQLNRGIAVFPLRFFSAAGAGSSGSCGGVNKWHLTADFTFMPSIIPLFIEWLAWKMAF